jgi:type VI protein secretion system component Hcp
MKTKSFFVLKFGMSHVFAFILSGSVLLLSFISEGQNVGIGTPDPTEKLQVAGKIFSSQEGFKFPDGSIQTKAANNYAPSDAGDNRGIIILDITQPLVIGSFDYMGYQNVIKVIDYRWDMQMIPGGESGPGTLTVHDLCITKNIDLASNDLLWKAMNGNIIVEMWLHFFTPNGYEYYNIKLMDVVITSFYQYMNFTGGNSFSHCECIYFQFDSAIWHYQGQDGEGWAFYPPSP